MIVVGITAPEKPPIDAAVVTTRVQDHTQILACLITVLATTNVKSGLIIRSEVVTIVAQDKAIRHVQEVLSLRRKMNAGTPVMDAKLVHQQNLIIRIALFTMLVPFGLRELLCIKKLIPKITISIGTSADMTAVHVAMRRVLRTGKNYIAHMKNAQKQCLLPTIQEVWQAHAKNVILRGNNDLQYLIFANESNYC